MVNKIIGISIALHEELKAYSKASGIKIKHIAAVAIAEYLKQKGGKDGQELDPSISDGGDSDGVNRIITKGGNNAGNNARP